MARFFPPRVALIAGGSDYERDDIAKSTSDVADVLSRNQIGTQIFDPSHDAICDLLQDFDPDVCFIIDPFYLGPSGETRDIRSSLARLQIRYTGSSPLAAEICRDKVKSKEYFRHEHVMVPVDILIPDTATHDWVATHCASIGLPVIVKPLAEGSSKGVHLCTDTASVVRIIESLHQRFNKLMLEQYIVGVEVTVAVVGTGAHARALVPIELELLNSDIYDYETKRKTDTVTRHVPARLTNAQLTELRDCSRRIHVGIGCAGVSRLDFRVSPYSIVCLEINSSPSIHKDEHVPRAAMAEGINYDSFILQIVVDALDESEHE